MVIFIYREDLYADKNEPPPRTEGVAELIIGKQRNGPTGVVKLAFIREFTRFENLAAGARWDEVIGVHSIAIAMIRPTVARVDLGALKSNFRNIVDSLAREQPAHAAERRSRW